VRLRLAAVALAGVLAAARTARADETFTVDYAAPSGCPDKARFIDEITRRTQLARLAGPGEQPTAVLVVKLARKNARVRGRLGLTRGTRSSERALEGATCDEAASALALVAALAIDPLADTRPVEVLPARSSAPSTLGSAPALPSTAPSVEPPHRGMYPEPGSEAGPTPLPVWPLWFAIPVEEVHALPVRLGATAAVSVLLGPAPGPMAGGGGWFEVASRSGLRWSARLGFVLAVTSSVELVPQGETAYRLLWVRAEGCVPGFAPTDWVTLYPCATAGGGSLWGELSRGSTTLEVASPWGSVGLAGRGAFTLAGPLTADLRLGAEIPFIRGNFVGPAASDLFTPAPAAFDGSAGLGLAF
jgi:hypothetical protein